MVTVTNVVAFGEEHSHVTDVGGDEPEYGIPIYLVVVITFMLHNVKERLSCSLHIGTPMLDVQQVYFRLMQGRKTELFFALKKAVKILASLQPSLGFGLFRHN